MEREKLFKKYYKNPAHDYEISETLSVSDDTGRTPEVCFVYSGRNRGKSFEISSQLIADAWYNGRLFGYIRRNDATIYDIEQYFEDKKDFIKDMTDGDRAGITRDKGKLKFYKEELDKKTGEMKKIKCEDCGYFFALSRQSAYKSLQYPDVFNLLFEEVLTDGPYLGAEPEKLMNLFSTCKRSKKDFRMWLVSNTVSVVNPYSAAWGIQLSRNKPGDIKLSKLFLGSADKKGHEEYLLIAAHYLQNRDDITKEEKKEKRNRIKTAISSNTWDELNLYPNLPISFMREYKPITTVIFEYDDLMIQADLLEVPDNIFEIYRDSTDEDPIPKSKSTMPILYLRRKTTEPRPRTRVYTNNSLRFSPYVTSGFQKIYKIDKVIDTLIDRGWFVGADNLTANDFMSIYDNLYT